MANLRRSIFINFFSSSGAALLQFALSIALARLLSPSEIGVFSITVVFVNIAHIFRDFGIATYLQREPALTNAKIRSAIGVLFTTSWSLSLVLLLASHWVGLWFKEPGIVPVMRVLALGFLFIPFGSVTNSLLVREFAADKQAVIIAVGALSFCSSCLLFAWLGLGAMSMAWANLVNVVVSAAMSIPYRPKGAPYLPSFRHWGEVVHFGAGTLLTNCADAINNAMPDILLGKLGSARLVGLFSRASSTVSLFFYAAGSTLTYGAVSYLSQAHQRGESLVPVMRRATSLLTGIGWPALALTALLGNDVVMALYGEKWLACVPAMIPLGISAAALMAFHYTPTALVAIGFPYLGAVPVMLTLGARVLFCTLLYDGTLASFAWSICWATLAAIPVPLLQQRKYFNDGIRGQLRALLPSAAVTLLCLVAAAVLRALIPASIPALGRLAILFVPLVLVWYLGLRLGRHALVGEVHLLVAGVRQRVRPALR